MAEEKVDSPDGQAQEVKTAQGAERVGGAGTLEQQLDEEKKKANEYLDSWRRSAAEFANYRKRVEKEKGDYTQYANALLLGKLIDVMDGFDAAFKAIPERYRGEPWVEGVRLVEQKLKRVLESEGVKPIEAQGKEFDPNYHEAMFYEPSPGAPEGQVTGEFQRGYTLGERVLRPSRVKVAQGRGNDKEDSA
jgi:molecular chaperone GrpE